MSTHHVSMVCAGALILSLSMPAAAAEKVTGINKNFQTLSEVSSVIPDKPAHTFKQITSTWQATGSADVANFSATVVEQQDTIGTDATSRGYGIGHTASGDMTYFSWEGTTKVTPKEGGAFDIAGEGKFKWLGGTGKYKALTGEGTYSCKGNQNGPASFECPWQGDPRF